MASSSMKKNNYYLLFKEERPSFYKIILKDSITLHKLGIPRKFVKNYGDFLSSHVMLKVPNCGLKWRVDIVRNEGHIWLQNGWPKFVEYYSIVENSFLVFQLEKSNCEFNVIIFDKTATEIDYPLSCFANGDTSNQRSNLDDDDDEEQLPKEPIKKKIKLDETCANTSLDQYSPTGIRQRISRNLRDKKALINEGKSKEPIEKESRSAERKLTFSNRCEKAKKATKKFTAGNPSFESKISSGFLRSCRVYVPKSFMSTIARGTKFVRLKVNNRCWSVKLFLSPESGTAFLSAGWVAFARENSLKVGDVCTYRLINNTDQTLLINVSIMRDSVSNRVERDAESQVPRKRMKVENFTKEIEKGNRKQSIVKGSSSKEQKFDSPNPSFRVRISSDCLKRGAVYLPKGFVDQNIEIGTKAAKLEVNNRFWTMKLLMYTYRRGIAVLSVGWDAFAKDNSLKVGDVCNFVLIDNGHQTLLMNVSITRD